MTTQSAAPPPLNAGSIAGWYPDPWRVSPFRWWDGHQWTANVGGVAKAKPKVPAWSSWPVILCGVPMALIVIVFAFASPVAVALSFVPFFIVGPAMWWLDRVEPEPLPSRIHAVLWGATVAALVASVVNTVVALGLGENVALVASAPLVEEGMKALGLVWIVRRKEMDGVMDGVVYAGWVALGFAVVEDVVYFATADQLGPVFILRALLTPFAHPLFTTWTGLAMGRAISKNKPIFPAMLWGYGLAVASHAAWNGSLALADSTGSGAFLIVVVGLFVVLFFSVGTTLIVFRRNEQRRFIGQIPMLASRYGLTPGEVQVFSNWRSMLATRKSLPKTQRKHFDGVHSALARLAVLHRREGELDHVTEELLASQLLDARSAPSA